MIVELFIQSTYLVENLVIVWIYYKYLKKISLIMCILKILIDLCLTKLKTKIKNTFVGLVYSLLVMKVF